METKYIDRETLLQAYEELTLKEAMEKFGIKSLNTLYRLLDQAGIPRKDQGRSSSGKGATRFALSD